MASTDTIMNFLKTKLCWHESIKYSLHNEPGVTYLLFAKKSESAVSNDFWDVSVGTVSREDHISI